MLKKNALFFMNGFPNGDSGDDDVNDSVLNVLVRFLMLMER